MYDLKLNNFIEKAKLVHGDKYNYHLVNYINTKIKVKIICLEHGEFEQSPEKHLNGQGCPICVGNTKKTTEQFIEKAKETHGGKYDYSLVNYINAKTKVKIICKEHGEFEQLPNVHLKSGCPKCRDRNKSNDEVISEFIGVHGDKYDYSLVDYNGNKEKLKIICKEHGIFEQCYTTHRKGHGCPKCSNNKKHTTEEFIQKAKEVHGDKYDYSLVEYKNNSTGVKIICKEHGEFTQLPTNHLKGSGCPLCKGLTITQKKTRTTEEFIKEAKEVHGDKYDYSLVNYTNIKEGVDIICPEHGKFTQVADVHLRGCGCPECGVENRSKSLTSNTNEFIEKAKKIHGERYDYSLVEYKGNKQKVKIICKEHGEFEQVVSDHLSGCGCSECNYNGTSVAEIEIKQFLQSLNINIIENDRTILNGKELDIIIPEKKLAIEYNGLYYHSNKFREINYHLNKTELCNNVGYKLIHIFEDEWNDKKEIVKSRIRNILNLTENKIYARKCIIKEVSSKESSLFLNKNHIQGKVGSKIKLGLYYNDELVSLMTFVSKGGYGYELIRFCNKINTNVIGGASKLLKHFISNYNPKEIISYVDRRWGNGGLYERLGFELSHISKPKYFYTKGNIRYHKSNFKKKNLVKEGFDKDKSEKEIMEERGFNRIYDCGDLVYKKTT